jgi:hypothetical protein
MPAKESAKQFFNLVCPSPTLAPAFVKSSAASMEREDEQTQ